MKKNVFPELQLVATAQHNVHDHDDVGVGVGVGVGGVGGVVVQRETNNASETTRMRRGGAFPLVVKNNVDRIMSARGIPNEDMYILESEECRLEYKGDPFPAEEHHIMHTDVHLNEREVVPFIPPDCYKGEGIVSSLIRDGVEELDEEASRKKFRWLLIQKDVTGPSHWGVYGALYNQSTYLGSPWVYVPREGQLLEIVASLVGFESSLSIIRRDYRPSEGTLRVTRIGDKDFLSAARRFVRAMRSYKMQQQNRGDEGTREEELPLQENERLDGVGVCSHQSNQWFFGMESGSTARDEIELFVDALYRMASNSHLMFIQNMLSHIETVQRRQRQSTVCGQVLEKVSTFLIGENYCEHPKYSADHSRCLVYFFVDHDSNGDGHNASAASSSVAPSSLKDNGAAAASLRCQQDEEEDEEEDRVHQEDVAALEQHLVFPNLSLNRYRNGLVVNALGNGVLVEMDRRLFYNAISVNRDDCRKNNGRKRAYAILIGNFYDQTWQKGTPQF